MSDSNLLVIALVVGGYSLIQSLFGVGLLVFGTPTLLLLGIPFQTALCYLLPASATISLLQLRKNFPAADLRREISAYCVPGVIVGLAVLISLKHGVNIRLWVGLLLLSTAAIRCFAFTAIKRSLKNHSRTGFALVGLIHGFSNMGGGLLSILVSSLRTEKVSLRTNVAFGYLVMALSQILMLILFWGQRIPLAAVGMMGLAALTYELVGQRLFTLTSERAYQQLLTGFIAIFGISLIAL
jgi:uncharacterized membrane protein YfcA